MSSAARRRAAPGPPCSVNGGPQYAMMASPMYLSMMPLCARIGADIAEKYRFMTLTRPCGVISSLALVKPLMSQNSTVITRRCPSDGQLRPVDQPFDDARIDIFAERLAKLLLEPQLLDHPVERRRQVADLIVRGGDQHAVEIAGLDRARALEQTPAPAASCRC